MLRNLMQTFILFTMYSCKSKVQKAHSRPGIDTTLQILTWGLPDLDKQRAMNAIAKTYGFEYYSLAGCVMYKKLLDMEFAKLSLTNFSSIIPVEKSLK